ncbi:uncharacterized protein EV420DRAFT_1688333 [Desarmillaria tabescens]|uniref:DUF6534 domain-containing protein n=1 Tax=Armillaria tabescens TaxID=1929756 RepID=A0AA39N4A4_ARMTA|nr:uncharacterized protein EV420DRAFT_1688333 [Desarmillaria tabescens]KAK0457412.1 hypothetical protein EV420DRAFT_1688333 [Desarmillaria tabescens]
MSSPIRVDSTLGAALIGFGVSCALIGALCVQGFSYFRRYPSDLPAYKLLVAAIWCLEIVDQAFIGHCVYYYTITNYMSPQVMLFGDVIWTLILQLVLGALVGTIVKTCFAMRVWLFSGHNLPITCLILFLTYGQLGTLQKDSPVPILNSDAEFRAGLAIAYAVRGFQLNKLAYISNLRTLASLSLGAGALTDIIIALSLSLFLRRLRTGYKSSDSVVNRLTVYAINTGVLTSTVSITTLILYDLYPTNFVFMAFYFVLSKLYAISFMCTLNTRHIVRGRGTDREIGTASPTAHLFGNAFYMVHPQTLRSQTQTQKTQLSIGIHQEVSVMSDADEPLSTQATHAQELPIPMSPPPSQGHITAN